MRVCRINDNEQVDRTDECVIHSGRISQPDSPAKSMLAERGEHPFCDEVHQAAVQRGEIVEQFNLCGLE